MRSRTMLALVLATTGLCGCGDDDGVAPDAGPADAGSLDGGGGPLDAGPPDAGPPDAGPPTPLEMSRDEARTAVGEAGLALEAIPGAERIDAEFLTLEVTFARLDAVIGEKSTSLIDLAGVIGEKSLRPASLPINAVPALIVARQVARASRDIDAQLARTGWATTTIPELLSLGMRLTEASAALRALSDVMWDRYREIVDSVDPTSFPEDPEYGDDCAVPLLPEGAAVHAIVEGNAGDGTIAITADCTEQPFQIRVIDEERGTELLPLTDEPMFNTWAVTLPEGTPSSVRVELFDPNVDANWPTCNLTVAGTRHWRGTEIVIDSAETSAIGLLLMDWVDASGAISGELQRLESAGTAEEQAIAARVRAYVAELYASTGAWRGSRASWFEDDYEIYDMTLARVLDPMGTALATSPQLADTRYDTLRSQLASLRSIEDTARQTLAPTHTGM